MLTLEQFIKICPRTIEPARWIDPLNEAMAEWGVKTPQAAAMFIAQWAHESGEYNKLEENLLYSSPERIVKTWPSRFDLTTAKRYVRDPVALANYVYADRLGNGDFASGDGFKFRGRGICQLTFRANYREAGKALGLKLESFPDMAKEAAIAPRVAGWFWKNRELTPIADKGTEAAFRKCTGLINGGQNGIESRLRYWGRAKAAIGG